MVLPVRRLRAKDALRLQLLHTAGLEHRTAAIAGLFPAPGAGEAPGLEDPDQFTNPDGSPNLEAMREALEKLGGATP